ncbi:MAG TPA: hypothetical protein VMU72_02615 [Gaiellaceae bacterium]|nr:hypothetical protein [Gaiellaceae bacterium]
MKARLSHLVMLGSSLAFLASLYLTWVSAAPPAGKNTGPGTGLGDLLDVMGASFNGWGTFGQAAALAAIALIVLVLVGFVRPELADSLPFGGCAIALATLALVNAAALRTEGIYRLAYDHASAHLSTGAYLGGAAALAALLGAAAASRDRFTELGSATVAAATLLTAGLVAAYVLPTLNVHPPPLTGVQFVSVGTFGTAIMLLIASFGLTFWLGAEPPLRRLSAAAVILVLAVGGFSTLGTHVHWPYEAWLAIGCAAGLLVLALATSGRPRLTWPTRPHALALEGAALLLASLFFNWERSCPTRGSGTCFVANGWSGGLSGGLVALFVVLLLGFRRLAPELAVAVAIYVAASGLSITAYGNLSWGAFLGFGGVALLLLAVGLRPWKVANAGVWLIPVAACLAFLAIPVATLSGRLSTRIEIYGAWQLRLLEVAAIVVALRLIGRWLSGPAADDELLLLPVALLAFTGFDLGARQHVFFIGWEGWLALALALLLVALGWLGRSGRLDDFRIPEEIWRVDRISAGEN